MEPIKIRAKHGPEYHIQEAFVPFFEGMGWHVERFIGNALQRGIPDLYLFNRKWGERWVDMKVHGKYSFTAAQRDKWPKWEKVGIGIWILGAYSPESCDLAHMTMEHKLLFQKPNWRQFWKKSWDKPDIDKMLEDLNGDQEVPRES